jgi:hypothetical protein
MLAVLLTFLSPFGSGIPAGVLLAQAQGLTWPVTAGLYLASDVVLALAFEPALRVLILLGRRVAFLVRFGAAMKVALARNAALFGGPGTGPVMLVLIAFGIDPMTGRAVALAAGHGWLAGWAFAITGDLLYYAVVAVTTLRLNAYVRNPVLTVGLILTAMCLMPLFIQIYRARRRFSLPD